MGASTARHMAGRAGQWKSVVKEMPNGDYGTALAARPSITAWREGPRRRTLEPSPAGRLDAEPGTEPHLGTKTRVVHTQRTPAVYRIHHLSENLKVRCVTLRERDTIRSVRKMQRATETVRNAATRNVFSRNARMALSVRIARPDRVCYPPIETERAAPAIKCSRGPAPARSPRARTRFYPPLTDRN